METNNNCEHSFVHQAGIELEGIMYDIFYCQKCLKNVKKERPCPKDIEKI